MKISILIFLMLVVSIIVILKLVTSPEPIAYTDISALNSEEYNTGKQIYQDNNEISYRQGNKPEINNLKLMAFARAFVEVQSYMDKAGSKVNYRETSKIVQGNGLSVEDYTMIATLINENSDYRKKFQKLINEAK